MITILANVVSDPEFQKRMRSNYTTLIDYIGLVLCITTATVAPMAGGAVTVTPASLAAPTPPPSPPLQDQAPTPYTSALAFSPRVVGSIGVILQSAWRLPLSDQWRVTLVLERV